MCVYKYIPYIHGTVDMKTSVTEGLVRLLAAAQVDTVKQYWPTTTDLVEKCMKKVLSHQQNTTLHIERNGKKTLSASATLHILH